MAALRTSDGLLRLIRGAGEMGLPRNTCISTKDFVVVQASSSTSRSRVRGFVSAAKQQTRRPYPRAGALSTQALPPQGAHALSFSSYSSSDGALQSPPLGSDLSPEQILSHFARPPFDDAQLLGENAELASRAMTHESYKYAKEGHNRRLAFLGRRTLKMFTTLFLHSRFQTVQKGSASHKYLKDVLESPSGVDSIVTTHRLGDKVGRQLGLEKVMRWTPAVSEGQLGPKETGLFKVRGVCVEALVGAICHERGAQEASKFIHGFILPSLLEEGFPRPVPEELKQDVITPSSQA